MGYKINGEVIISNSKDIDNVGIATIGLVDAKVSSKAITEQTEGGVSDVTGADEVLIYDAEGGSLLRVTVDEFISGSGIGTLVTDFDGLNVTGVATISNISMASTQSSITLPDSAEIILGDSSDFSMHHDGDHTYLDESGQGNLKLRTNTLKVSNPDETKTSLLAQAGSGIELYFNNSKKLETTNTGVLVSGMLTSERLRTGDIAVRNVFTLGITTIQDHLEVNDSTGAGTEYNLNVKTNGSSTFGVLGNGNILLGNNSSAPFMATNDHHATSKKYVDDAISASGGGSGGTHNFVGFGTGIVAGAPVILREDGTISFAGLGGSLQGGSLGSAVEFESGPAIKFSGHTSVYDTQNQKVVVGYIDGGDSNKGKVVVGTVNSSNNSISFGSPVVFSASSIDHISLLYDPDEGKVIVFYANGGNNDAGTYHLGEVSGSSFQWGSSGETTFYGNSINDNVTLYDTTNDKLVFLWNNTDTEVRSVTGEVNANDTLSLGATQQITDDNPTWVTGVFHTANSKTIVVYGNASESSKAYYAVGTYSATDSQTWVAGSQLDSVATGGGTAVYDPDTERIVVFYIDASNNSYGMAIVGSLSGNTITWGTSVTFNAAATAELSATYDTTDNKVIVSYKDVADNGYAKVIVGTVGGTNNRSITFDTEVQVNSQESVSTSLVFDPDEDRVVIAYNDAGSTSGTGDAKVFNAEQSAATDLTAENYIGMAAAGISSGSTGAVTILGGVDSNQTGLTTARTYYVLGDGTISLTPGAPSVVAGTSISATEILVR